MTEDAGKSEVQRKLIIETNLAALESNLLYITPNGGLTPEHQAAVDGISQGERLVLTDDAVTCVLRITYDTKTGEFLRCPYYADAEVYSLLRLQLIRDSEETYYVTKEQKWATNLGKYKILLKQPGDFPTTQAFTAAIAGDESVDTDDRTIHPERIDTPENLSMGQMPDKLFNEPGDRIVIDTIKEFNKKYGPLKVPVEQLFGKIPGGSGAAKQN